MSDPIITPSPAIVPASRRTFLKTSGALAAGGAFASTLSVARSAHAAGADETIKLALIGCGGRGTGACGQALSTKGPVKLVAMADAFRDRLDGSLHGLKSQHPDRVDVSEEMKFVGFDAYQKAIDSGVDMVILATPPGFRPIHFEAAVKAGKNVFMEKPVATDAPGIRRVLAAAEEAKKKDLKVGVGLQRRHDAHYIQTIDRIHNGDIGDIVAARVYWNGQTPWCNPREALKRNKPDLTEMEYQMRNWYYFVWICGDHIVEQHIHNLDVAHWVKGGPPTHGKGNGMGGCEVRKGKDYGEIFDHHCVEFEYPDGTHIYSQCRHIPGCWNDVSEHMHGSNGYSNCSNYIKTKDGKEFHASGPRKDPYQQEHDDLFAAIREGKSYNEAQRGAEATMMAIFGRMCTYSGEVLSWDDALNSKISVMPTVFDFHADPPHLPDADGFYKLPVPGQTKVV
jgi:myo-inositol 2-dehydrogenase/D-chiro-inositol 1-dehydrogenase